MQVEQEQLKTQAVAELCSASVEASIMAKEFRSIKKYIKILSFGIISVMVIDIFTAVLIYGNQAQLYRQANEVRKETKEVVQGAVSTATEEVAKQAAQQVAHETKEAIKEGSEDSQKAIEKLNELTQTVKQKTKKK